jgi:hypothetical protein
MSNIAAVLTPSDPLHEVLADSAVAHADAALPNISSGDYMGEHWLASFAVLMLS